MKKSYYQFTPTTCSIKSSNHCTNITTIDTIHSITSNIIQMGRKYYCHMSTYDIIHIISDIFCTLKSVIIINNISRLYIFLNI